MRALSPAFQPYGWAMSTVEAARIAGIEPRDVLRFDGNTPPVPPAYATAETIAPALAEIQRYPHGGFPALLDAIAEYAGVDATRIVIGAGADDLLLLLGARTFAGPGDVVHVLDEPTYPLFRIAAWLAGAEVGSEGAAVTFCCRPHNPTGALGPIPDERPLVVDEAYFEYCGDSAAGLEGVVAVGRSRRRSASRPRASATRSPTKKSRPSSSSARTRCRSRRSPPRSRSRRCARARRT